jgi:hypothetical protein
LASTYACAVFRSPTYREGHAEFLNMDYRGLPLTLDLELPCTLAAKGEELVALHVTEAT